MPARLEGAGPRSAERCPLIGAGLLWGQVGIREHCCPQGTQESLSRGGLHSHRGPQISTQTGATGHMHLWGGGTAAHPGVFHSHPDAFELGSDWATHTGAWPWLRWGLV